MKEYTLDDKKIREFYFEDWQITLTKLPEKSGFIGANEEGFELYISQEQWELILNKIKFDYWTSVNELFKREKDKFEKQYNNSEDKTELLKRETDKFYRLFYENNSINDLLQKGWDKPIKQIFEDTILKGQRIWDGTLRPFQTLTDAYWKYYQWLKTLGKKEEITPSYVAYLLLRLLEAGQYKVSDESYYKELGNKYVINSESLKTQYNRILKNKKTIKRIHVEWAIKEITNNWNNNKARQAAEDDLLSDNLK
jgi:hypothetical protein